MNTRVLENPGGATVRLIDLDASEQLLHAATRAGIVAIDTETTGLDPKSARLQTIQAHVPGYGTEVIRVEVDTPPTRIGHLLADSRIIKVFHHALFDLGFLYESFDFQAQQVRCTKVAAKILWPGDKDRHSLKGLVWYFDRERLDKTEQTSDWTRREFTEAQIRYAARDAEVLPGLLDRLTAEADSAAMFPLVQQAWDFLPTRVLLDSRGTGDVFAY